MGIPAGTKPQKLGWEISDSMRELGKFQGKKNHLTKLFWFFVEFFGVFLGGFDFIWLFNSGVIPKIYPEPSLGFLSQSWKEPWAQKENLGKDKNPFFEASKFLPPGAGASGIFGIFKNFQEFSGAFFPLCTIPLKGIFPHIFVKTKVPKMLKLISKFFNSSD